MIGSPVPSIPGIATMATSIIKKKGKDKKSNYFKIYF